jgi:hypothetical protein
MQLDCHLFQFRLPLRFNFIEHLHRFFDIAVMRGQLQSS